MIYIESDTRDPARNLALEEYVFEHMDPEKDYFMLWQNKNTIVIGKFQNTAEEINQDYVKANGIRVVRRLSGGGAVYHDDGNLNFTFIVGKDRNPEYDFSLFVVPLVNALKKLGVEAEFNGRNDVTINGKKFSGNSQYCRRDRIMHHGCIMLDSNLDQVQGALRVKEAKFESKSIKSVRSRVTTINDHAPRHISMEELREALKEEVFAENEVEFYELTDADWSAIDRLAKEKYETWEWNYGFYSGYSIRREEKFPAGLVTIQMEVEHGVISGIRIYGDFFGNRDIKLLEDLLTGVSLNEELDRVLANCDLEEYMHGISPADLASLLR